MSEAHTWFCRGALALLAVGGLVSLCAAQTGDVVDDFKNNSKLAAQKLEQDVKQAVLEVQQLKAKEPAKAVFILKASKHMLETDTNLGKEKRAELLGIVTTQLKALEAPPAADPGKTDPPVKKKTKAEEQYDLYQKYGSAKPPAGSPSTTAGNIIGGFDKGIKDYKGNVAKTSATSSSTLPYDIGDIPEGPKGFKLPSTWAALTDLRKKMNASKLSEEEASLIKAMNSVLSVDYVKQPFQQVIKNLEERTGQTIVITRTR